MKGVAIILSLLMLLLSIKPCSDGLNAEQQEDISIELDHSHSNDTEDSCPTTCMCSCCGTSITFEVIQTRDIFSKEIISTLVFSEYNSDYRFDFHSNIWQPPRFIS